MTELRHIDLKTILQRTVNGVYGDLVTRPTGKKVRGGIEAVLAALPDEEVAIMDFTTVRCLDISCADEIVGKLLATHGRNRSFVLQGVSDAHCEAIEQVLERHQLAVLARDRTGRVQILGPLPEETRRVLHTLIGRGAAEAEQLAGDAALPLETVVQALRTLVERRLAVAANGRYMAVSAS